MSATVITGDCLDVLRTLAPGSVVVAFLAASAEVM